MKGYCSWSVGMVCVCVCQHVFSQNVAVGIPNVDMWVCATGAQHSRSQEQYVCFGAAII